MTIMMSLVSTAVSNITLYCHTVHTCSHSELSTTDLIAQHEGVNGIAIPGLVRALA